MNHPVQEAGLHGTGIDPAQQAGPAEHREFAVCIRTRRLSGPGCKTLILTRLETRLVAYLAEHPDREICKSELLRCVWDYNPDANTHTVETHVWRLRQKIGSLFPGHRLVRTGSIGYAFDRPVNATQPIYW